MSDLRITFPDSTTDMRGMPPSQYVLSKELADAVQVALALQQPLLITGEPGTGKTRLAYRVAHDLHQSQKNFLPEPIIFETQTTATAQDLFYYYDALGHFHDANLSKAGASTAPVASDYIELRGLGKAIALSNPEAASGYLPIGQQAASSVVLIDEIDKAPRDFPNNLLAQLEKYEFRIREDGNKTISMGKDQNLVVILTSNSEKALPEAFLRRCVFFHIPFPSKDLLLDIVRSRVGHDSPYADQNLVEHFAGIRKAVKRKAPATAELISWLKVLELHKFADSGIDFQALSDSQKDILRMSYSVLAKTHEDLQILLEKVY